MNKKVIIYDIDRPNDQYPPENLGELIAWLYKKLQSIPIEFRDSATVEMGATESYGCPDLSYEISYEEPETDEETESRLDMEQVREYRQFS
jgi:hypothetical protein